MNTRRAAGLAAGVLSAWVLTGAAAAGVRADPAGEWLLSYKTTDGTTLESTLTIKREGDTLSGTLSSARGSVALNEISANGEDVSFAIVRVGFGDRIRIEYTGRIDADRMTLQIKFGERPPVDATATRRR